MTHEELVEKVARALNEHTGLDPDAIDEAAIDGPSPNWKAWENEASIALAVADGVLAREIDGVKTIDLGAAPPEYREGYNVGIFRVIARIRALLTEGKPNDA